MDKKVVFAVNTELWKQVKVAAAVHDLTMKQLVDQALREKLEALNRVENK